MSKDKKPVPVPPPPRFVRDNALEKNFSQNKPSIDKTKSTSKKG